jgi:two-component system sensor histidine kinase DesK
MRFMAPEAPGGGQPCVVRAGSSAPRRIFGLEWFYLSWLLYLVFWVIAPLDQHSTSRWVYFGFALAAFLVLYFVAHGEHSLRARRWAVLGMLLLALVYVPVNLSAFGIYIFIAATLPDISDNPRMTYRLLGLESVVIVGQAFLLHFPSWAWTIALGISALTAINIQHFRTQRKADARLRMAHDEIEQLAKTAERERIARDLHDVLGHTLSLISVKSELAARMLATDPERTAKELDEIQTTARRALSEVRQTVAGYRARGLEAELEEVNLALVASGVTLAGRPEKLPRLPAQHEASLSLILRECVTNIVRHAGAQTCAITLVVEGELVRLAVRDDGRGMRGQEGNGLTGMRERVAELGGTLRVTVENGTVIAIELPLPQAAERTEAVKPLVPLVVGEMAVG